MSCVHLKQKKKEEKKRTNENKCNQASRHPLMSLACVEEKENGEGGREGGNEGTKRAREGKRREEEVKMNSLEK